MWYVLGFAALLVVVWVFALKLFPHTISLKEGLIMLAIQTIVLSVVIAAALYRQGADTQILNGQVVGKEREKVSCEHSYKCNCYYTTSCSGTGSSRSCTRVEHCSTCYEHSYDVDWNVHADIGSLTINRIDRQGLDEPPRWSQVQIGEPFSKSDSYYNYIKASPFSIFNKQQLDQNIAVPSYPGIFDYYKINRIINFGSEYPVDGELNDLLNISLKELGPKKHVNIVVFLHNKGSTYSQIIKTKHLGGKINDVYVVIDISKEGVFNDVAVFSWSKSDLVNVKIRDDLLDIGKYDAKMMDKVISSNIYEHYVPRSIEDFKYLEDDVEIPKWAAWFAMIFGVMFPFIAAFIAHKHEIA